MRAEVSGPGDSGSAPPASAASVRTGTAALSAAILILGGRLLLRQGLGSGVGSSIPISLGSAGTQG